MVDKSNLAMTEKEIIEKYQKSDKKASDIQIIAELNGCSKKVIEEIITENLGPYELPKKRTRKTSADKTKDEKVPAENTKEKVSRVIMEAIQDRMDEVNSQLMELTREILVKEQRKQEMENVYQEFVKFMETHDVEGEEDGKTE